MIIITSSYEVCMGSLPSPLFAKERDYASSSDLRKQQEMIIIISSYEVCMGSFTLSLEGRGVGEGD